MASLKTKIDREPQRGVMRERGPLWVWVGAAALTLCCSGDAAEEPPARVELIEARLLDQLDRAQLRLGALPPESAPIAERELLHLEPGAPLDDRFVALDEGARPPRVSPRAGGELGLEETICAILPAAASQHLRLQVEMAPDHLVEARAELQRIAGQPVVVELDELPESAAGCSSVFLVQHGLMQRQAPAQTQEASALESFDLAFTTMSQTRAVAVVLVAGLVISYGLQTQVLRQPEATARLGRVRLTRLGVEGITRAQLREQAPPDPLLADDARGLRVKPSLQRQQRDAVMAPPGTRLCWPVEVAQGSTLRVALGVDWEISVSPGRPVTFRVSLDDQELSSEELGPTQRTWVERRIELPSSEGSQELCLETEAPPGPGTIWSLWGTPEITASAPRRREDTLPETIILVSIDTLRADRLGLYGCKAPTSPVLDELAERSTVFEHHLAQTGWTLPSHVSMLTGLTPEAHGVTGQMDHILDLLDVGFDPTAPTLAAALRQAGYSTHGIVSAPYLDPSFGFSRGFDSYDTSTISSHLRSHEDMTAPALSRITRRLIARSGHRPLFIFLHVWDVHYDYIPPLEDLAAVHPELARRRPDYEQTRHPFTRHIDPALFALVAAAGDYQNPPDFYGRLRQLMPRFPRVGQLMEVLSELYDGEVRTVDRHLGLIFDELRRQGRGEALLVVTGDHGESFMEHGTLAHGVDNIYQEGLVVPLIIHAPGRLEPGRRQTPSMTVDISATLLDLLDLDPLPGAEGHSLVRDEGSPRLVVGHDGTFGRLQAALGAHRLLVWGPFGSDQLFDHDQDPEELVDLGERLDERRAELRLEIARYLLTHGRGLHAALVGPSPGPVELVFEGDSPLRPAFVYGPPATGALSWEEDGRRLKLQAAPGAGEVVALTVLVPDEAQLRWSATIAGQPVPEEHIFVGRGSRPSSSTVDDSWQLENDTLPDALGRRASALHLWRTAAYSVRAPLSLHEETFEQLRALGYLRDRPRPSPADAEPDASRPGPAPADEPPARGDR